jgi:hypothetical protein
LKGLQNGTFQSPETTAGITQFDFSGGTHSSPTFDEMKALFDQMKVLNDGVIDNDTDSGTWTTAVPVYDSNDCSNPNNVITIVGFATVKIWQVSGPPSHTIWADVLCDNVEPGRGSGGLYGTKGSIPGLVQ